MVSLFLGERRLYCWPDCSTASGDVDAEARITWIEGYVKTVVYAGFLRFAIPMSCDSLSVAVAGDQSPDYVGARDIVHHENEVDSIVHAELLTPIPQRPKSWLSVAKDWELDILNAHLHLDRAPIVVAANK